MPGPIIRVRPNQVHISDADFYDSVLSFQGRWDQIIDNAGFGTTGGTFATVPHDLHKARRAPLNPFFSKRRILALEPVIQRKVNKLVKRMGNLAETRQPLGLEPACSALSMDVIGEYALGKSFNFLDQEDFNEQYYDVLRNVGPMWHMSKPFPWLPSMLQSLPTWLIRKIDSGVASFTDLADVRASSSSLSVQLLLSVDFRSLSLSILSATRLTLFCFTHPGDTCTDHVFCEIGVQG